VTKIRCVLEQLIDERIEAWDNRNGYSIEEIISALGFTFDEIRKFGFEDNIGVKRYVNNCGTFGSLELNLSDDDFAPILFEVTETGEQVSQIIFTDNIIACRYVKEKDSKFGMVISLRPKDIHYFSFDTIEVRQKEGKIVKPDEVKVIMEENPILRILAVKSWADEINSTFEEEKTVKI